MARMKSLTADPPHGWRYLNPVFGMKKDDSGSFRTLCQKEYARRKANKYLCEKHNLSLDMASVEYDVEQANVARMIAGNWNDFLLTDAPQSTYSAEGSKKNSLLGGAVGGVKRVAAGVGVLLEWLGSGAKPVDQATAERRAAVCATCPKNQPADILGYFTSKIASKIMTQIQMKNDLQLKTSQDEKLGVCTGCDCPLPLKVWTPLKHVLAHTSDEVKERLATQCWVLHEKP